MLRRFAPSAGAATSPAGANGSCVYFLDRFYDNVHVERKGVTSLNWPKPKLKFSFNKKVSSSMQHGSSLVRKHGISARNPDLCMCALHMCCALCWHRRLQ